MVGRFSLVLTWFAQLVDERYAVLTIRDTYNRLVRPRMDPKIKQRWTTRNIWKHLRFHQTDTEQVSLAE